jgi:hypothetical protein
VSVCVCKEFASSERSWSGTLAVLFEGGNIRFISFCLRCYAAWLLFRYSS